MSASPAPIVPPWVYDRRAEWVTVGQFAHLWNKHRNTIRQWCDSGFMSHLGYATYRDPKGNWFIRLSNSAQGE